MKLLVAFLKGIWIFGLLTWGYVILNISLFPRWQFAPLSIYIPIPTDVVGIAAFVIAFCAFTLWEALR